jgi:hypothetical protein
MSQTSGNRRATFEPGVLLRAWQQSATCGLRANERIWRGMMDAAQSQTELGQDLLNYRLATLRPQAQKAEKGAGSADFIKAQLEQHLQRVGRIAAGMRKTTDDLTKCLTEATQLLFGDAASAAQETVSAVADTVAAVGNNAGKAAENLAK